MNDFEIQIKIAVYSTSGQFIKQCDNSSLSDKTINLIMNDVAKDKEVKKGVTNEH